MIKFVVTKLLPILISLPASYLLWALFFSYLPVNIDYLSGGFDDKKELFLCSNGVHLDLMIKKEDLSPMLSNSLILNTETKYVAFGWGDRNFYINTPRWSDLKLSHALYALFWKSPTLMHVSEYRELPMGSLEVPLHHTQLQEINDLINRDFRVDSSGKKMYLEGHSYGSNDLFYEAHGSYSCFKTCNTWTNSVLKKSGVKACFWTPFDFALMRIL